MAITVVHELRRAYRRLRRSPASAAGIVVVLTLGIAISVSMFSVLYGVVLRGLPYPGAERIVTIYVENPQQGVPRAALTTTEAEEALADVPGFEYTAYTHMGQYIFTGGDAPLDRVSVHVSPDYFSVFGVQAAIGRTLIASDFSENRPVVVLSHVAWMEMTGGDPDAIGRPLPFQGGSFELVGVLPAWFTHRDGMMYLPQRTVTDGLRFQVAIGRLAPGISPTLAEEMLQARLTGVHEAQGLSNGGWRIRQVSLLDELVGDVRGTLFAIFALALLVLLVACSATASLVSIRLERRNAELAIRRALGATDTRVVLDVALELLVLVAMAAVGGVLLAYLAIEVIRPMAAGTLPRAVDIGIDKTTLLFAAVAAVGSVVLSGMAPLLRTLRSDPSERLRGGVVRELTGGRRVALLPAIGIGLSMTALIVALALAASLVQLGNVDPGFRSEGIVALELNRRPSPEPTGRFLERAAEELLSVPGVRGVSACNCRPPTTIGSGGTPMEVTARDGEPMEPVLARTRWIFDGYHGLLGIPLRRGADISERHTLDSPRVVVISETLARQAFRGADPIGQVLMVSMGPQPAPFVVVGVSADTRNAGLGAPSEPEIAFAMRQFVLPRVTVLVDSTTMAPNWRRALEEAIWRADPQQPISRSYALADDLGNQTRRLRFFAVTTGWFAALALLLGAAGINAVVAAMQRRRAREIGLRMALGAAPRHAARLVLGYAARVVGLGLGIGALLAALVLLWLRDDLYGMGDGVIWGLSGLTALVLIAAGLAAAAWPAWRASRVAPMRALRYQ